MTRKNIISSTVLYVSLLAFIFFAVYILLINQEVFYTAHGRSEFICGSPYFHKLLSKPFGIIQYAGAWLTQYFYEPALGTGLLAVIWILIFLVGTKAFRLQGKGMTALMLLPVACLLTSVVDLGYWVYVYPVRGYWFSQSVGYLLMLLLLWVARNTPRKWHFVWYLLFLCVYPALGWFAMLLVLCLAVMEKPTWRELIAVVVLLITPSVWHALLYSNLKFDDVVLAGMPHFMTASDSTERLTVPFWVLACVSVLIPLCRNLWDRFSTVVPVIAAAAAIIFISSFMYYDKNYIDEMRMVRYAETDNWQEVLRMAEENKKPTTTMIFLKNIALMNEGGLLDRSFKMGNIKNPIYNPDSLHVTLLDIASPLVYYNYGMLNEAIRLNFEMAIQAGFSPFYLKMLSRCAQAKGDRELMERYTTLLHHHPFYGNWQPSPVTETVKSLQHSYADELTGVENSDRYVINSISLWYESDSKVTSEQALFFSMLRCDSRRFWPALRNYVKLHMNEHFPMHAQEAYILYMDKSPEKKRMMLPVEQSVYDRYKQFWESIDRRAKPGMTIGTIAEEIREEWGDTYWYYNLFGR